jgi:hypothetical protein
MGGKNELAKHARATGSSSSYLHSVSYHPFLPHSPREEGGEGALIESRSAVQLAASECFNWMTSS